MSEPARCCRIDQATGTACPKQAEFEILPVSATVDPDDYTHACQEHVGELLGSRDGKAEQWSVYQLTPTL